MLGTEPDAETRPKGLLAQTTSLGWRVLAENPRRELVVGTVTQLIVRGKYLRPALGIEVDEDVNRVLTEHLRQEGLPC